MYGGMQTRKGGGCWQEDETTGSSSGTYLYVRTNGRPCGLWRRQGPLLPCIIGIGVGIGVAADMSSPRASESKVASNERWSWCEIDGDSRDKDGLVTRAARVQQILGKPMDGFLRFNMVTMVDEGRRGVGKRGRGL